MKKRIGIIILSMFFVLGLVGCGNGVAKEAIKQGKEALQKKEYDKALVSLDIALGKDAKNKEANALKSIINDYLTAKEYLEQGEVENAQKILQGINSQYSEYSIKYDIDSLKKQVDEDIKTNEIINNEIKKLTTLYNDKKYDDAKKLFLELNKSKLNDKQKEEINNINNKIDTELKNIEDKKNIEKEKVAIKKGQKQLYINKLNNIEAGLKDLEEKYDSGITIEMKEAAGEEYRRWDNALNEIYNLLKTQLSSSDMKQLKEEEIQWISNKEKKAKEDSLEFKGGTMESLVYINSLAKTTKDRCYELVEKYMK